MELCSRRRGLVTLGRIISSSQSVAYWSGADNVNQLVKLVKIFWLVPANDKSLREKPARQSGEKRGDFQPARCGSNGQPWSSPDLTGGPR